MICTKDNELQRLIVGGSAFTISRKALLKYPDTLLGSLVQQESEDDFTFDRSAVFFDRILNLYRTDALHVPQGVCVEEFIDELEFWRIPHEKISSCCQAKVASVLKDRAILAAADSVKDELCKRSADSELIKHDGGIDVGEHKGQKCALPRHVVWSFLEDPTSSKPAMVFMFVSAAFVVTSITTLVLSSIPGLDRIDPLTNRTDLNFELDITDKVCTAWFTAEYLVRLASAPFPLLYVRSALAIIDLVSIIPFYVELIVDVVLEEAAAQKTGAIRSISLSFVVVRLLRLMRVFRVLRVFKIIRYSVGLQSMLRTVRHIWRELVLLLSVLLLLILVFATLMYFVEIDEPETPFRTIPMAMYWATITLTTVGIQGRVVASIAATFGAVMIALPVSIIVEAFSRSYAEIKLEQQRKQREQNKENESRQQLTSHQLENKIEGTT